MEEIQIKVPNWVQVNFEAFESALNGEKSKPLHKLRRQAFGQVQQLGFPTPANEDWKYTNMFPLIAKDYLFASAKSSSSIELNDIKSFLVAGSDAARIVFIDGIYSESLSNTAKVQKEISVTSFTKCFAGSAEKTILDAFQARLLDKAENSDQTFVALNTAFLQDGVFVHVKKNSIAKSALQILFVSSKNEGAAFFTPRVLVTAEMNSEVQIIESHVGLGSAEYFSSAFCEIDVAENARVDLVKIELENRKALHVGTTHIVQSKNSRCAINLFSFGGKLVRNEVRITLNGQNCETFLNGLTVLNGDQHVDNHTVLDHAQPHCESHEHIKGVYAEKSKGVFNGTIIVRPDAQKTNAIQSNKSLLLSKDATIDTKPQLKIWADDVKCTHGATIGQLDEDSMFYLRSRGIDKNTARNLLVRAFAADLISSLKDIQLREYLEKILMSKLEEIEHS